MTTKDLFWEDFPAGLTREFGRTQVTREAVIAFASQFDPQPFHLDEAAARESLFGGLCASGWHTGAMMMRMMCDEYLHRAASLGSPGLEKLRWAKPVLVGDTLRVRHQVLQARPMASRPGVGLTLSQWEVLNQHGEVVMSVEGWGMFRRRSPEHPAAPGPAHVREFWFGEPPYAARAEWFRKDDAFDEQIRHRFGVQIDAAVKGRLPPAWDADTPGRLAQLLLLDQFTRNVHRGQAAAFAGDARALALARAMVERGEDRSLPPLQRWFVYLPFEHAEDLAEQDRSVALFETLAAEEPALADALDYARRHRDVIVRFGRFPHRNAALGRESTPEEAAYLQQPGAGF